MIKKILTIAGSDCSGGAGIQADIKTITVHKMYAMSAITALTAQNTTGVYGIMETDPEFVASQIDAIFNDIFPDAVKIGMVSNRKIIEIIAEKLIRYKAKNIVIDPVMVSTSGYKLISEDVQDVLTNILMPIGTVITPNILEAQELCGFAIKDKNDMVEAGKFIQKKVKSAVLVKGGHLVNNATDVLCTEDKVYWYNFERIDNPNTHGTGCTLSSAIACNLAEGKNLDESIKNAKSYLNSIIFAQLDIGKGRGPLDHTCLL